MTVSPKAARHDSCSGMPERNPLLDRVEVECKREGRERNPGDAQQDANAADAEESPAVTDAEERGDQADDGNAEVGDERDRHRLLEVPLTLMMRVAYRNSTAANAAKVPITAWETMLVSRSLRRSAVVDPSWNQRLMPPMTTPSTAAYAR